MQIPIQTATVTVNAVSTNAFHNILMKHSERVDCLIAEIHRALNLAMERGKMEDEIQILKDKMWEVLRGLPIVKLDPKRRIDYWWTLDMPDGSVVKCHLKLKRKV